MIHPDPEMLANLASPNIKIHSLRRLHPTWTEQVSVPLFLWQNGLRLDLFYSVGYPFGLFLPARKFMLQIHDASPWRISGQFSCMAETYWRVFMRSSILRADFLLADSNFTRNEVSTLFGVTANRISVLPISIDPAYFRDFENEDLTSFLQSFNLLNPYFVTVGALQPRKNLVVLLHAFEQLSRLVTEPVNLVFAYGGTWRNEPFMDALRNHPYRNRIKLLQGLPMDDLIRLYRGSRGLLMPSIYEGFGMPAVEAFALGVPVLASRIPSLIEVTGGIAAYASPADHEEWARCMIELLSDKPDAESPKNRRAQASRFTQDKLASSLAAAFCAALNS